MFRSAIGFLLRVAIVWDPTLKLMLTSIIKLVLYSFMGCVLETSSSSRRDARVPTYIGEWNLRRNWQHYFVGDRRSHVSILWYTWFCAYFSRFLSALVLITRPKMWLWQARRARYTEHGVKITAQTRNSAGTSPLLIVCRILFVRQVWNYLSVPSSVLIIINGYSHSSRNDRLWEE